MDVQCRRSNLDSGTWEFCLSKKTNKWAASWSLTDEKQYVLHESLDESVFWNHYKHFEFLTTMKAGNLGFNNFLSLVAIVAAVVFSFPTSEKKKQRNTVTSFTVYNLRPVFKCGLFSLAGTVFSSRCL